MYDTVYGFGHSVQIKTHGRTLRAYEIGDLIGPLGGEQTYAIHADGLYVRVTSGIVNAICEKEPCDRPIFGKRGFSERNRESDVAGGVDANRIAEASRTAGSLNRPRLG